MEIQKKIRFYSKELPEPNDKVVFEYLKLEETLVRIKLLEYNDIPGVILLTDLTRQKHVNSLQKLCPINQIAVGEVLSIEKHKEEDSVLIFVSIKNILKDDQKRYLDYFYKSKKLCNFMKRIAINTKKDLIQVCQEISWPLYAMLEYDNHPLDRIDHPDKLKRFVTNVNANANANVNTNTNANSEESAKDDKDPFSDVDNNVTNTDDSEKDLFHIEEEVARLMLSVHEQFFGKLIMQKTIRIGIISYAINGSQIIKDTLKSLQKNLELNYANINVVFTLRDIPIYEIKLKSIDNDSLEAAHTYILTSLQDNKEILFKHISTKS